MTFRPRWRAGLALWALACATATLAVLLAAWAAGGPWGAVRQLEDRLGDVLWRLGATPAPERRLVVVDIDERSLQELGPWPWSRAIQARMMERLAALGARQQVWDIVFAGEGAGPTAAAAAGNRALSAAVLAHRPVLAQVFALAGEPDTAAHPEGSTHGLSHGPSVASNTLREGQLAGAWVGMGCPAFAPPSRGYLANLPAVVAAPTEPGVAVGHITPRLAADGVLRHQPALVCNEGRVFPALALAALAQAAGGAPQLERGGVHEAAWLLRFPGDRVAPVPLDERGDLRLPWRQRSEGYLSLSAADVLAGRVPSGLLDGAWVLVGGTAFGLNDRIATPHHTVAPGLVAHAQLITALLDGRVPATPRAAPVLQAVALLAGLALLGGLMAWRRPAWLPLAAAGGALMLWAGHAALLLGAGIWVGWALPALGLLVGGFVLGGLSHARSRIDRDRLYRHLASYLPAPVAATLAGQSPSGHIQARQQRVTVMFADIRNFSAYCEARPPEEAAAVLHTFFTTASRVVQAHGGVVEALQGDSVVATWNADHAAVVPGEGAGHAQQALLAARELLAAMAGTLPDPAPAGLEPLALGVGLETGPALTGSIGPQERRSHMVMGRTVTIASRLVGMTAELAHPLLVGEGLASQLGGQLGGQRLQSLGTFMLDGLRVPHHVYAWPVSTLVTPGRLAAVTAAEDSASATDTATAEPGPGLPGATHRAHLH